VTGEARRHLATRRLNPPIFGSMMRNVVLETYRKTVEVDRGVVQA